MVFSRSSRPKSYQFMSGQALFPTSGTNITPPRSSSSNSSVDLRVMHKRRWVPAILPTGMMSRPPGLSCSLSGRDFRSTRCNNYRVERSFFWPTIAAVARAHMDIIAAEVFEALLRGFGKGGIPFDSKYLTGNLCYDRRSVAGACSNFENVFTPPRCADAIIKAVIYGCEIVWPF